jgi:hypothetical protein
MAKIFRHFHNIRQEKKDTSLSLDNYLEPRNNAGEGITKNTPDYVDTHLDNYDSNNLQIIKFRKRYGYSYLK